MKLKDYFLRLQKQAKLGGDEITRFIDSIPEGEISDLVTAMLEEHFMTKERAASDPEIIKKVKAEVYNGVDANVHELINSLPSVDQDLIKGEPNTHKKIKLLEGAYKKQYEEFKKNAPDAAKVNEEHVKTIKELTERLDLEKKAKDKALADREKEINEIKAKGEQDIKSYRLRNDITGKLAQIEFAKEFTQDPVIKDTIFNSIISNVAKNNLDYDEDGHIVVQEIVNGVPKPKFKSNSNEIVTLESLLEAETSRYLKRNNGDQQETQKTEQVKVQTYANKKGQTLAEKRAQAAGL